jgi:hypothetical protein
MVIFFTAGFLSGCSQQTPTSVPNDNPDIDQLLQEPPSVILQDAPSAEYNRGLVIPVPLKIKNESERILGNITITKYQHTTEVDEGKGIYKVDCSGLVDYVLKRVAIKNYQKIPYTNPYRPYAEDFYHYFVSLSIADRASSGNWCQIGKLADAEQGDILVYEYTQAVKDKKGTTGHGMIV